MNYYSYKYNENDQTAQITSDAAKGPVEIVSVSYTNFVKTVCKPGLDAPDLSGTNSIIYDGSQIEIPEGFYNTNDLKQIINQRIVESIPTAPCLLYFNGKKEYKWKNNGESQITILYRNMATAMLITGRKSLVEVVPPNGESESYFPNPSLGAQDIIIRFDSNQSLILPLLGDYMNSGIFYYNSPMPFNFGEGSKQLTISCEFASLGITKTVFSKFDSFVRFAFYRKK